MHSLQHYKLLICFRLTADWPVTLQMGNVLPQAAFSRLQHKPHIQSFTYISRLPFYVNYALKLIRVPRLAFTRSYNGQAHDVLFEVKRDQQIYDLLKKNEQVRQLFSNSALLNRIYSSSFNIIHFYSFGQK